MNIPQIGMLALRILVKGVILVGRTILGLPLGWLRPFTETGRMWMHTSSTLSKLKQGNIRGVFMNMKFPLSVILGCVLGLLCLLSTTVRVQFWVLLVCYLGVLVPGKRQHVYLAEGRLQPIYFAACGGIVVLIFGLIAQQSGSLTATMEWTGGVIIGTFLYRELYGGFIKMLIRFMPRTPLPAKLKTKKK